MPNSLQALVFLYFHAIVNGVKRAFSSPRRLISVLVFVGYYGWLVFRPLEHQPSFPTQRLPHTGFRLDMHALDGIVFALFAVLSMFTAMSVTSYRGGFKAADVDVLFPTPVSPKLVMFFRLLRDYMATLLLPLFMAVLGWRGTTIGIQWLVDSLPGSSAYVGKAISIAWLLMALAWVSLGYAASLFVNRSDLASDRNRRRIMAGISIVFVAVLAYITLRLRADLSWETANDLAHNWGLRAVFFTATAASAMVMAPLEGNWGHFAIGLGSLLGIIALGLKLALTQVDWLYDQAAARGIDNTNLINLKKRGDMYGIYAEQARKGKIKAGRIASWVSNRRVRGGAALLWKEAILQLRTSIAMFILTLLLALFVGGMMLYLFSDKPSSIDAGGIGWLGLQGMLVFMNAIGTSQMGYIEFLNRVDLQKPLPLSPATIVFWEVASKAIWPSIVAVLASLQCLVMAPALWQYALTNTVLICSLVLLMNATVLMVVVLFPDIDDPTQRGFRGLMILLGSVISVLPGMGAFIGLQVLTHNPLLGLIPAVILNSLVTVGVSTLAGNFYSAYNPSE